MSQTKKTVSVVSPAYNESESLPELVRRVKSSLASTSCDYEILIVENGSVDTSIDILKKFHQEDPRVRYLKLSRNFGHQGALIAGLENCTGDCAITIDADLQQPPELIPEMIRLWEAGNDVVFTTKDEAHPFISIKKIGMSIFYKFMSVVAQMKLSYGQSDFRLIDRKVIDVLKNIPEREKFLRGLIYWMGYKQTGLKYKVADRIAGESKFSFFKLFKFAFDGIFAFSIFPLRIYLIAGVVMSGICLGYGFWMVVAKILERIFPYYGRLGYFPPGWVSVVYLVTLIGGFQLIGIGLLGEYLGLAIKEVKGRPSYIVVEDSSSEKKSG